MDAHWINTQSDVEFVKIYNIWNLILPYVSLVPTGQVKEYKLYTSWVAYNTLIGKDYPHSHITAENMASAVCPVYFILTSQSGH